MYVAALLYNVYHDHLEYVVCILYVSMYYHIQCHTSIES